MFRLVCALCALIIVGLGNAAQAHQLDQSYVYFKVTDTELTGRFEATPKDILRLMPLDTDGDGVLSRPELEASGEQLFIFFRDRLTLASEGTEYQLRYDDISYLDTPKAEFAQLNFTVEGLSPVPDFIDIDYEPLVDADNPQHLGFALIESNTKTGVVDNESSISLTFAAGEAMQQLSFVGNPWNVTFVEFLWEGMFHIWGGLDHLLFLMTLLVSAVMVGVAGKWRPAEDFQSAFWNLVKIVTVFTLAHSVSLTLSTMNVLSVPIPIVEPIIALSIVVVALANIWPVLERYRIWVALLFGLFHGFAFANVLAPLGIDPSQKIVGLVAFNIGIEIGQIAIIFVAFPLLYMIRNWSLYNLFALKLASVGFIVLSGVWLVERSSGLVTHLKRDLIAYIS